MFGRHPRREGLGALAHGSGFRHRATFDEFAGGEGEEAEDNTEADSEHRAHDEHDQSGVRGERRVSGEIGLLRMLNDVAAEQENVRGGDPNRIDNTDEEPMKEARGGGVSGDHISAEGEDDEPAKRFDVEGDEVDSGEGHDEAEDRELED